ncbi:hypothetical protein COPEUT_01488 [Coprococcus eutactus ATCC 27759]|nr:hypothetical protein COPEUT_01488 [Coprococcus eutactus ATCC 27759]
MIKNSHNRQLIWYYGLKACKAIAILFHLSYYQFVSKR